MYKILKADKDTYITDRVVEDVRRTSANLGSAGSLDLFKLYGYTSSGSSPNIELSRLLVHFDLEPIRELVSAGKINLNDGSFTCNLKLFDVYGGQPTPRNFRVMVHPLSRSFDEGLGRDVVLYNDDDVANFLTGSRSQGPWIMSGANAGGALGANVDYLATAVIDNTTTSLGTTQLFETGEEDLYVDVTDAVSATLAGVIPDEGFRVSLTASLETDTRTYFVKRFASRTAHNEDKHPQLIVRFDDSIQDDSNNLIFDASSSIYLYNYVQGSPAALLSASNAVSNVVLKLATAISGGFYTLSFPGTQRTTGVYSASVYLSSNDATLAAKLATSGSVRFVPIWGSTDGTVSFLTGTAVTAYPPSRGPTIVESKRYVVSVTDLRPEMDVSESPVLRVNIFDPSPTVVRATKTPVQTPGVVLRDVYYSIRDEATDLVIVPFDRTKKSTRLSSDGNGMYFRLDCSNLNAGRSYVVDVLISTNGNEHVYRNVSAPFRVVDMS